MRALALATLALALACAAAAQEPDVRPPVRRPARAVSGQPAGRPAARDSAAQDTSAAGRGRGLPQRPSRDFQAPDSVAAALLRREGFRITRYSADSVRFLAQEKEIRLAGSALVQRDQSTLEADSVRYIQESCEMRAAGVPRLFDQTGVVVGQGMRYDACNRVGLIGRASTEFQEGSATWYVRGDIAVDNQENRSYLSRSTITSCDLADPHYHFAARDVKWVSKTIMVARPAVLYVADVPVMWLPFIFQDLRRGRRSGLIPPSFGLNDIVRNSPSYKRHVVNLGYYWAMGDYSDAQVTLDWYSQRVLKVNGRLRYRWLDRFIEGGVAYSELHESGGSVSRRISLSHSQQFSLSSSLSASLDYASSSSVISRTAVDPVLAVATIDSRLNFSRRFAGGTLSLGGSRTQSLDKPQVTMSFPVVAFAPLPIRIGRDVTWSPSFNFTNATLRNGAPQSLLLHTGPGTADTVRTNNRSTRLSITTPLRIGRWSWSNSILMEDSWANQRQRVTLTDPTDSSRSLARTYAETFSTALDWSTGISLPVLFQGTWNLQPTISIQNTGGGAFMLRNLYSGGRFVSQGKRLGYSVSISPTFFGLFGGIGPVARIRHAISPSVGWQYAPAATLPEAYARALSAGRGSVDRRIRARHSLALGLSQNFEAKLRPPPRPQGSDSAAGTPPEEGRKIKLLSIQSGGIAYDFEQAKVPGRTGWTTNAWPNTFTSDLLRGFTVSTSHSLFEGDSAGYSGKRFRPFLTSVSMRFSLSGGTVRTLGSLLGLRTSSRIPAAGDTAAAADSMTGLDPIGLNALQRGPLATRYSALERMGPSGRGGDFTASLALDIQRRRPARPDSTGAVAWQQAPASSVMGNVSFSPTRHWSVAWQTQFNFTTGRFGEHVVRLDRDLHDWRATFSFVQSPNGNFAFSFEIHLIDQPDIKFDYDQRNIGQ